MAKVLLKQILKKKGISFKRAEMMTGVSKSTLIDIAAEKSSPRLNTLEQIAEGMKLRINDLFDSPYK